jgi:hypothetical protein
MSMCAVGFGCLDVQTQALKAFLNRLKCIMFDVIVQMMFSVSHLGVCAGVHLQR